MNELAKFAWVALLCIFFVGSKIVIIFGLVCAFFVFLYWLKPEWFWPDGSCPKKDRDKDGDLT